MVWLPGTRDFSLLQSIQTVPTVHRGVMDTDSSPRGMRLEMRTAVTANFTLVSSGFEQNYKGKIFNGENYTLRLI